MIHDLSELVSRDLLHKGYSKSEPTRTEMQSMFALGMTHYICDCINQLNGSHYRCSQPMSSLYIFGRETEHLDLQDVLRGGLFT